MDAYWRAANYLSVGQIYLYDNPLLKRPLAVADVKRMLLGHWGTTPGQNFVDPHSLLLPTQEGLRPQRSGIQGARAPRWLAR
jgi:phosphoketolase